MNGVYLGIALSRRLFYRFATRNVMTTADLKMQIVDKLNQLSPKLLSLVSNFINTLIAEPTIESESVELSPDGIEDDPIFGMIDGPPDFASSAEDILQADIQPGQGWSCQQ